MAAGSLRRRLLWLLIAALGVAWVVSTTLAYRSGHREIDAMLDAHLRQSARLLEAQSRLDGDTLDLDDDGDDEDDEHQLDRYGTGVAFQLRTTAGQLLLRSTNAPHTPLSRAMRGFSVTQHDGRTWRVYSTLRGKDGIVVHVAEDHAMRERIARRVALSALAPMLLALPLLTLAVGWVTRRALRPLDALGEEIGRRDADDLSPVSPGPLPEELVPLVRRLDALFLRIRDSLDSERRFTSHAAHELRTPVAAVRAQAEVAATARDPQVREAALRHCIEACDRMTGLVSQLLLLARADELDALAHVQPCRLDDIARTVLAGLTPPASRANLVLGLDTRGDCGLRGDPALLAALLRNLVDNAIRHGRGEVRVDLVQQDTSIVLRVQDDGAGVPAEALSQLGRRFYRGPDPQGTGSGLGLSIVGRIVALHGGSVRYANATPGPGFEAVVTLPR